MFLWYRTCLSCCVSSPAAPSSQASRLIVGIPAEEEGSENESRAPTKTVEKAAPRKGKRDAPVTTAPSEPARSSGSNERGGRGGRRGGFQGSEQGRSPETFHKEPLCAFLFAFEQKIEDP